MILVHLCVASGTKEMLQIEALSDEKKTNVAKGKTLICLYNLRMASLGDFLKHSKSGTDRSADPS